ncbi:hypothetical protein ANO11243_079050 [Dothideomycetidae sp. 11243]|nr:hypothetical protein ANO11243_079050 [fungal sp. No.11243]
MTDFWTRLQRYVGLYDKHTGQATSTISQPPPFGKSEDVVFVALDMHGHKYEQSQLKEAGIAIFDTRDIKDISPGRVARQWIRYISTQHLVASNGRSMIGRTCLARGDPNACAFGDSEVMPSWEVEKVVLDNLQMPQIVFGDHDQRKVVLVVLDEARELCLLRDLGWYPTKLGNISSVADMKTLCGAAGRNISLEALERIMEVNGASFGNAGNNATMLLQMLLRMVIWRTFAPEHLANRLRLVRVEIFAPRRVEERRKKRVQKKGKKKRGNKDEGGEGKEEGELGDGV